MAIVTTTHYVPGTSGWSDREYHFRLKVVQAYNNVTNKSTLTVSLESYHASYSGTHSILDDNAYIKADGTTLVTLGNTYKLNYTASTTWKQVTSSSGANEWTYTVIHDNSGNATVSFEVAGRMYMYYNGTDYYGDMDKTLSYTFTGLRAFSLSISAGEGSKITVKRTASSGGSTGYLSNGAVIYYGDKLTITFDALSGYELETHKVNNDDFTSGGVHTVASDVEIMATAKRLGLIYIFVTSFNGLELYIHNGTSWVQFAPYIHNGVSWMQLS